MKKRMVKCWEGREYDANKTLFLDTAKIKPGDILLTAGRAPSSYLIRIISGTSLLKPVAFSHAAIVLTNYVLFESMHDGVGQTYLPLDRYELLSEGGARHLTALIDEKGRCLRNAVVMRPTGLQRKPYDTLVAELARYAIPREGTEYPMLEKLVAAVKLSPLKRGSITRMIAKLVSWFQRKPINPGLFCSELVAAVLGEMECPLLAGNPTASTVAPADFGTTSTQLEIVPDAIVRANPEAETTDFHFDRWHSNQLILYYYANHVKPPAHTPNCTKRHNPRFSVVLWREFFANKAKLDQTVQRIENKLAAAGKQAREIRTAVNQITQRPRKK